MKTVAEILKETGLTDEQIAALDPKVTGAFTQVVSTATQTLEAAELAKRAQAQQYDSEIAPALDAWANEKAQKDAEIAFYKTQLEGAKAGGFLPATVPGTTTTTTTTPPRNAAGEFVAGRNTVPGSPQYMTREEGFRALSNTQWVLAEYMRLNNGAPPPDDLETLSNEAVSQRMPLRDYAAKKYGFAEKREAIKAAEQKKHDDAIRQEVEAKVNKEWAEKVGNNPNVRTAVTSQFATVDKAVKEGQRKSPIGMSQAERHAQTRAEIQKEIAANETVQ